MKIYISGPITGTTDYMERFTKIQKELEYRGYEVINPALINSNLPKSTTWEEYMRVSLVMLEMCDAIYLLKGWRNSKGATLEYNRARQWGLKIHEEILYENIYL